MKRIFSVFLLTFLALVSLQAFDIVIPADTADEYRLYSDDDSVMIDNTIFTKRVLPGIRVERFEDNITVVSLDGYGRAVVLLNASTQELKDGFFAISYDTESPVVIAVNSPIDVNTVIELEASALYTTETLEPYDRSLLKKKGIPVKTIVEGDMISIDEDDYGNTESQLEAKYYNNEDGFYVKCPTCGTMIYIPH